QIAVAEKDHLLIPESVDTEIYNKGEEPSEVDNRNSIEQPSINLVPQALQLVKNCLT
ncbi:15944_t:CDS:1, partial [Racocetra fulgida]